MGKTMGESFTPKQLSNYMKAKGLQKLKHYCQMCNKQCRDENGFNCHKMSESHVRQMEIFGQNPDKFIRGYSLAFETAFLDQMRRCHGSTRVSAKAVYDEYILDRHHVHMNATMWNTLTEFVTYLGKSGKCEVEDTEKGWFITYNATHFEGLVRERHMEKKRLKGKLAEEKNREKRIEKQIERAFSSAKKVASEVEVRERDRVGENTRVVFALAGGRKRKKESSKLDLFEEDGGEETASKERGKRRRSHWLCRGIVVKVKNRALAEEGYYNKKGIVMKVLDKCYGEIEMLDTTGQPLRLHQDDLETVIPGIGGPVRIVNGSYRGSNARLLAVDTRNFCATVELDKCDDEGRVVPGLSYDDICKVHV